MHCQILISGTNLSLQVIAMKIFCMYSVKRHLSSNFIQKIEVSCQEIGISRLFFFCKILYNILCLIMQHTSVLNENNSWTSLSLLFSHQVVSNSLQSHGLKPSLSLTISQSLPKFMSIESVMSSNHLILCRPLPLLPSIFPRIRVFSN